MMKFNLKEQIEARDNIILANRPKERKYFNLENYIDLSTFSTYIFITPRNIGKTYSGFKFAVDVYKETGEYTIWMRTSESEIKECIKDFSDTKYDWWPDEYQLVGNSVIDNETGKLVLKFVALSTAHNLASMKSINCFGIIYDEFLPRTNRVKPSFKKLADFIKTAERGKLLTVILMANATTLNSEILTFFDIWTDQDEKKDYDHRLYYKRLLDWDDIDDIGEKSTAYNWAALSPELEDYMYSSEFLIADTASVIPLSRLEIKSWLEQYRLNEIIFSIGLTIDKRYVIAKGSMLEGKITYNLTPTDSFKPLENTDNVTDVAKELDYIFAALQDGDCIFTDWELRDVFFKFALKYVPTKL